MERIESEVVHERRVDVVGRLLLANDAPLARLALQDDRHRAVVGVHAERHVDFRHGRVDLARERIRRVLPLPGFAINGALRVDAVEPLSLGVMAVVALLEGDVLEDEQAHRHGEGEPADVERGVGRALADMAQRETYVGAKHNRAGK